ncbi:hypothetical protein QTO34_018335 [Cnephaeus nilssonii]|uniref:Uncharacterized protein n=1 Tax=Cnephaeus nilssonii TaxID=3371016 RepID=A0AA40LPW9_CNENI|nr:hypothetical protein QTO34_018335 [Eptesicus nilssonii]
MGKMLKEVTCSCFWGEAQIPLSNISSTNVLILLFVYAAITSPLQTFQFWHYEELACEPEVFMIRKRKHPCSSPQPS